MRPPRPWFSPRIWIGVVIVPSLILALIVQQAQVREARAREAALRASLAEAEAKLAWRDSIEEWRRVGDSPELHKRWADGMRRASGPPAR